MKRQIIRVEPLATWLDNYKAPTSSVVRHGDTIYVTGHRRSIRPQGRYSSAP